MFLREITRKAVDTVLLMEEISPMLALTVITKAQCLYQAWKHKRQTLEVEFPFFLIRESFSLL